MTPAERLSAAAAELRGLPTPSGRWGGRFAEALADWLEDEAEDCADHELIWRESSQVPSNRWAERGLTVDANIDHHFGKALKVADLILPADSDRAAGQGQVTA